MWKKPNVNTKEGPGKTNLNKELQKYSANLTAEEIKHYATARVTYEMKIRNGSGSEMSQEEFDKRVEWLTKRVLIVQLRHGLLEKIFIY